MVWLPGTPDEEQAAAATGLAEESTAAPVNKVARLTRVASNDPRRRRSRWAPTPRLAVDPLEPDSTAMALPPRDSIYGTAVL